MCVLWTGTKARAGLSRSGSRTGPDSGLGHELWTLLPDLNVVDESESRAAGFSKDWQRPSCQTPPPCSPISVAWWDPPLWRGGGVRAGEGKDVGHRGRLSPPPPPPPQD